MKLGSVTIPDPLVYGAAIAGGLAIAAYSARTAAAGAGQAARSIGNAIINENPLADVNQGTPYKGFGIFGTLGNLTNRLLGGLPQWAGERIAQGVADAQDVFGR